MKAILILCLLSFSVCLSVISNTFAAGDPASGRTKALLCIGCHGMDGNNDNSLYPILAGQGEGYLSKQLNDFKTGARVEEHMSSMVEGLSLEDIPHVAKYFSLQQRKGSTLTPVDTDKEKGKRIYLTGLAEKSVTPCAACHAINGMGNAAAKFPALAGQHADYVSKMLKEFRRGKRHNDPTKMMRNIAVNLSDEEIKDLSHYISMMKVR